MPARKPKSTGPTPVDAITHADKRTNIPTADAQDFITPDIELPIPVRYPRDPSLDPQLVWKGKDDLDGEDLIADAPAIYIQEKIVPRVIIENLRQTANRPEDEPELTLFDAFDGLPELDLVDFYRHEANWSNRMILGDSLNVMASLAEREALRGKVQMIYMDPPYGIKFGSNWQASARKRDVRDGRLEDASREVEQIKAFRDTWELGIHSYLAYLRDRLMVARELLTDSGSVFVQIGDENVHLVRSLMDEVFGPSNYCGLVAYKTTAGLRADFLATSKDYICWYAKDRDQAKFRRLFLEKQRGDEGATQFQYIESPDGDRWRPISTEDDVEQLTADGWRVFAHDNLTSTGFATTTAYEAEWKGKTFRLPAANVRWKTTPEGMARLALADRLMAMGNTLRYKRYLDDFPVFPLVDVWNDTGISGFAEKKL